jgi:hypothetical protein
VPNKNTHFTDGEWHIIVIDLSKTVTTYTADDNGKYAPRFLRFDAFNSKIGHTDAYLDIAFIGFTDDLNTAVTFDKTVENVTVLSEKSVVQTYSSETGNPIS